MEEKIIAQNSQFKKYLKKESRASSAPRGGGGSGVREAYLCRIRDTDSSSLSFSKIIPSSGAERICKAAREPEGSKPHAARRRGKNRRSSFDASPRRRGGAEKDENLTNAQS